MSNFQVKYSVEMVDKMSKTLQGIDSKLNRFERNSKKSFEEVGLASNKTASRIKGGLVKAFALIGTGAVVKDAISTIASFGRAMSTLEAVTGATSEEMRQLRENAKIVGNTTEKSATDAANAQIALARAGLKTNEILGATSQVVDLAVGANLSLEQSAEGVAKVMRGMGMSAEETTRIVDTLTQGANNANTNVSQLIEAFRDSASVFSSPQNAIEELTSLMMVLADRGIQGSQAGTALRSTIVKLGAPSTEGAKKLKKYGLSLKDVSIQSRGTIPVLQKLQKVTSKMGENEETSFLKALVGEEALPRLKILIKNIDSVSEAQEKLANKTGITAKVAKVMSNNLEGDFKNLQSKAEGLKIALLEGKGDSFLRQATQQAAGLVDKLTQAINKRTELRSLAEKSLAGDEEAKKELEAKKAERRVSGGLFNKTNEQKVAKIEAELKKIRIEKEAGLADFGDNARMGYLLKKRNKLLEGRTSMGQAAQAQNLSMLQSAIQPQQNTMQGNMNVTFANAPTGMQVNSNIDSNFPMQSKIDINTGSNRILGE
jgi:TP901 family phage tail tape measure protein